MARYSKKREPPEYVGISIPRGLAEAIKPALRREGYVSLSDLVRDLLREWGRAVAVLRLSEAEATEEASDSRASRAAPARRS
jgi:Arc/MetJ-type ribon-helix-helix transcriptional regulator